MNKNGRCVDLLSEKISKEECCRQHQDVETAWSEEDMDSGALFFYRVVGGGIPCYACKGETDVSFSMFIHLYIYFYDVLWIEIGRRKAKIKISSVATPL